MQAEWERHISSIALHTAAALTVAEDESFKH